MAQTMKGKNTSPLKSGRPGQRQQERLMRIARRRRRRLIITSTLVALTLIALIALGFWQFQRYSNDQANAAMVHATATARALITPTPAAGPATPPPVDKTPVKLADGLQYIDIKEGSGPAAHTGSTVSVQYTGWLQSSGKKFDSSYDHGGQPFPVTLGQGQVIKGWDEGLVGIKAGGTRRLIIPGNLAYGPQGNQGIPPNATLVFDVTAISVK